MNEKKKKNNFKFKIGDSVVVKPDVTDHELNIGIGGWQGRVSEIRSASFGIRSNLLKSDNFPLEGCLPGTT